MSSDVYESILAQLEPGLREQLRLARNEVMDRMVLEHLSLADGWQVGFRKLTDPAKQEGEPGATRYYFVPVRVQGGAVVDVRPDLSHSVVLV